MSNGQDMHKVHYRTDLTIVIELFIDSCRVHCFYLRCLSVGGQLSENCMNRGGDYERTRVLLKRETMKRKDDLPLSFAILKSD